MNLLLHIDIHRQSAKYIINEQSMNTNVFLFFFSFVFLQFERARERGYTKFGIRRNSPKGTYLISLMEFRGESFFFYGLIDFMLFLNTGLKKMASSCLAEFLRLLLPRVLGFGSFSYEPCPTTNFFFWFFSLTGRRCHFRFRVPANHLASLLFLPVSGDQSEGHQV